MTVGSTKEGARFVLEAEPGTRWGSDVAGARVEGDATETRAHAAQHRLARIFSTKRPHVLFSRGSLAKQVLYATHNAGTVSDFLTGEDVPACTMHVVALFSSTSELGRTDDAIDVCRVLVQEGVSVRVHAVLEGGRSPRGAQTEIQRFEEFVPEAKIVTLMGRDVCLGDAPWKDLVDVQRAFSENYEGELRKDIPEALEVAYGAGQTDRDLRPVRVFPFRGVLGDLQADFAAAAPRWEWTGKDVALFLLRSGEAQARMASVLTRRGLPKDVEDAVAVRGRGIVTFEADKIASLVPLPGFDHEGSLPAAEMERGPDGEGLAWIASDEAARAAIVDASKVSRAEVDELRTALAARGLSLVLLDDAGAIDVGADGARD